MAALAARKCLLFSKATSRIRFNSGFNSHSHSHLNDSPGLSCSPFHLHPATPPRGGTNPVEPGQGGSEPRLRRSSAGDTNFSWKPGRSSSSHTQGPTEPRLDHQVPETRSDQSCATSHPARCRNRANRTVYTGQK
jgi:hypothetical protein